MKNFRHAWSSLAIVSFLLVTLDHAHAQNPRPRGRNLTKLSDSEREQLAQRTEDLNQAVGQLYQVGHTKKPLNCLKNSLLYDDACIPKNFTLKDILTSRFA